MFASTTFVYWSVMMATSPLPYSYLGIYIALIFTMLIVNLVRRKSVIYTLTCILTMNYLLIGKYMLTPEPGSLHSAAPLFIGPYYMMAFDAEKREHERVKSHVLSSAFRACACLVMVTLLNDATFPLELPLGVVFVLASVFGK